MLEPFSRILATFSRILFNLCDFFMHFTSFWRPPHAFWRLFRPLDVILATVARMLATFSRIMHRVGTWGGLQCFNHTIKIEGFFSLDHTPKIPVSSLCGWGIKTHIGFMMWCGRLKPLPHPPTRNRGHVVILENHNSGGVNFDEFQAGYQKMVDS